MTQYYEQRAENGVLLRAVTMDPDLNYVHYWSRSGKMYRKSYYWFNRQKRVPRHEVVEIRRRWMRTDDSPHFAYEVEYAERTPRDPAAPADPNDD